MPSRPLESQGGCWHAASLCNGHGFLRNRWPAPTRTAMAMRARIRSAISPPERWRKAARCACPILHGWAWSPRRRRARAGRLPGFPPTAFSRGPGIRGGTKLRQGYAERPLGDGRLPGRIRLGLFSRRQPVLSCRADRGTRGRGAPARRHGQLPRVRHGRHRRAWRTAHGKWRADHLHVGGQRLPDRGARGDVRARAAHVDMRDRAPAAIAIRSRG
jgi:hypothetical protein